MHACVDKAVEWLCHTFICKWYT